MNSVVESTSTGAATPVADPIEEARRLLSLATDHSVALRVLGGVAIALVVAPDQPLLPRTYQDIDLITEKGSQRSVAELLVTAGYTGDDEFNAFNSHRRLLYFDPAHQRQVDVFVGAFSMCHRIPIEGRLLDAPETIPLPELLLTKLQIVELNSKDLTDILTLLYYCAPGGSDTPTRMSFHRVGECCAVDWGLWRTAMINIDRLTGSLHELDLQPDARERLRGVLVSLSEALESAPKSSRWRLRARVGDRVRWYEAPEDVT